MKSIRDYFSSNGFDNQEIVHIIDTFHYEVTLNRSYDSAIKVCQKWFNLI
jgi:hypothetical protein